MVTRSERRIPTSGLELKILFLLVIASLTFGTAYGHGIGSETINAELDGKTVTLEINSSTLDNIQQFTISLIDFDSKVTLRDVTFEINSKRGEEFLFEREFKVNDGSITLNFISKDIESIIIDEPEPDLFGSLLGIQDKIFDIRGPNLADGGLYTFDVVITTATSYNILDDPLIFNSGISIAQTTRYNISDPNFGDQYIDLVTYYDKLSNFDYNPNNQRIEFTMPFEWTLDNINRTDVVHIEFSTPTSFGDMLSSGFTMYVNDLQLAENVVAVDDFFADPRTVHFTIYQKELLRILENGTKNDGMEFIIIPDHSYPHISSVTDNGQFRILLSWEPQDLRPNSNAVFSFDITDVFLRGKPVAVNYELDITQNDIMIYTQSGTSKDSRQENSTVSFVIPDDISGIAYLNFKNIDGNSLAKTSIPVVFDRTSPIPSWIKQSALWWTQDEIDDETFLAAIQYLIQNDVIVLSNVQPSADGSTGIPTWIRTNALWWTQDEIDDETFLQSIKFLLENGIISI